MDCDRVHTVTSNCWVHKGTADPNQQIQLSFCAESWFSGDSSFPKQEVLAKDEKY